MRIKIDFVKHVAFQSYSLLIVCAVISAGMSYLLYKQTENILEDKLKERLISVVSTSTLVFHPAEFETIKDESAVETTIYRDTVKKLEKIRAHNNDLKYAYILRPTDNADIYTYIADADSIDPTAEKDLNNDGIINDEDALAVPGDEYDVSDIPALRNDAQFKPVTDAKPVSDQWGSFLSAYAPIISNGKTEAILGIDVEVTDYLKLIRRTLVPFLVFIVFLLAMLTLMTLALIQVWNKQVNLVKELDKQKDELLGLVAHQLATPITSLKWYVEMLREEDLGKLNEDQKKHLISMTSIGNDLSELVSMILDVSRIQLGKVKIEKQELNLNELFQEILEVIEPKAEIKKIAFIKNIPSELPRAILDKRYTRMTIENLLSNAMKYTPKNGEVSINAKIENNILKCEVIDSGVGIPKADQSKIFGKMYRASNVRNNIDGNGFGLYVAKGAIEAQGGTISFQSQEGKGTKFSLSLPLS